MTSLKYFVGATEITSPYTFPIGTTFVRCVAADDAGNVGSATFSVTVVPAAPAKKATYMTFAAPSTSAYASARLSGHLKYGSGSSVPYRYVTIEQYSSGAWKRIATAKTTSTGYYSYTAKPTVKTGYRARFAGDAAYLASYSASKSVLPKVRLTRTSSWSTLKANNTYYATGYIQPKHIGSDAKVRILAYKRASNGKYYYKKGFTATYRYYSATKTRYRAAVKLPAGTWKLRAYHAKDSKNAATYGSSDYLRVK